MREPDHAAAELQDQIIRTIFAVGLHLQSTAEIAADPLVRSRLGKALSDLDGLVRVIWDNVLRPDHHLSDRAPRGTRALCEHPPFPAGDRLTECQGTSPAG